MSYEYLEVWYPLLRFCEEGIETFTLATEQGKRYLCKRGGPCQADVGVDKVDVKGLDALILPGGWSPDYLRRDKRMVTLVRDMFNTGKPVASICHGAWMLCSARVISGKRLTCYHSVRDDVENAGGKYEDSPVVVDGNLITSRVPADLPQFCRAILEQLPS
ncbi:hypothetical protein LSAT2_033105 [Lamellibrachia satsuma]|nr:hypothetical protein LSAT2_033105 [Lamellibrachia satsuma]